MKKAVCVVALVASFPVFAGEPFPLSAEEYKMYRQYQLAMEDARVQKLKPEARLPAIAKDAGFKLPALKAAVEKGEAAGDLKKACEKAVTEAFTAAATRPTRIDADLSGPHAVLYLEWQNDSVDALPVEATTVAGTAAPACPIAATLTVWAQDKAQPKKRVFQALINNSAASQIKVDKAKDFAVTRYMRLFEKVKSVANGDDLSLPENQKL